MKYVRLTSSWGTALLALILGVSSFPAFRLHAETSVGESIVYPIYRIFEHGRYAAVTEATLERIFGDNLRGPGQDLSPGKRKRLARHLYQLCKRYEMDPALILSVIQVESSFRTDVVSPAGAVGLMQIMPATARFLAARHGLKRSISARDLQDPFLNLSLGVAYLRDLRNRYAGMSPYFHLAAYNLGPHRLDQLRSQPGFKPVATLKYYRAIMRGVNDWRHYGTRAKTKANVARESHAKLRPSVDPA